MDKPSREQNKAAMFQLVEKYSGSDLTQKQFCAEHNLSLVRFQYWYKRYKENQTGQGGFVPVQICHGKKKTFSGNVEILYPNGVILRLPITTPTILVRNFISGI